MKLAITILHDEDKLEDILHQFKEKKLNNITIINSNSKINGHNKNKHNRIYGSIRTFLDYDNDESRIILNVADQDEITRMKEVLKNNVSSDQYIFFTIAITDLEGLE